MPHPANRFGEVKTGFVEVWIFGVFGDLRGVGSLECLGKVGLGCLKVWMGLEVLEGFGMCGGSRVWEVGGVEVWGRGFGGCDVCRFEGLSVWVVGGVLGGGCLGIGGGGWGV